MIFDILAPRSTFADFDRLFAELSRSIGNDTPATQRVDVAVNDNEALIAVSAPGLDADSIDVTMHGDIVTIHAQAQASGTAPAGKEWIRRERQGHRLDRSVRLPFPVDDSQSSATYRNGVLAIRAPRLATSKPKRVAVTST